ncbi:MAG: sporulation initiation inhibitor Soj [bacterium]|nr:MAG: sporulation initiation inhibitor Soj [bacterium]
MDCLSMKAKTISISNQKGGVGKTTTAINLSAGLAITGKKVLLIDLDPQGNATSGLGISNDKFDYNIYHVLIGRKTIKRATINIREFAIDLVPSDISLIGAKIELITSDSRESLLKDAISKSSDSYDFIIIDCPPSLGILTINALVASDSVIIPVQCEYYAMEGVAQLLNTIRLVRATYNADLDIEGFLLTMYDKRNNLSIQVANEMRQHFSGKVFSTHVPRNVRLSESPSFGKPVIYYEEKCAGAQSYLALTEELLSEAS